MKQAIIFDFDGTLANTKEGIINCYAHTAEIMGLKFPPNDVISNVIGALPSEVFEIKLGVSKIEVERAVSIYRERYEKKGIFELSLYPHVSDLLETLTRNGYLLGIASLKDEKFLLEITEHIGILKYFKSVKGTNQDEHDDKESVLRKCLKKLEVSIDNAILIGDSKYDAIGAKQVGMDFVGVTYGFGFKKVDDVMVYPNVGFCKSVRDLETCLNRVKDYKLV